MFKLKRSDTSANSEVPTGLKLKQQGGRLIQDLRLLCLVQ